MRKQICRVLIFLVLVPAAAQTQGAIPFSSNGWELAGDAKFGNSDGRDVLRIGIGAAVRHDVKLEDGTIDVDIKTTHQRSFIYVNFRVQGEGEGEEFYLRPHKSGLVDAFQYAPTYQGQSSWQLYYGARGTAAPAIPADRLNHLRIVLSGRRAAFFLNDTTTPVMVLARLAREPAAGYVELKSFTNPPNSVPAVEFSNLQVRPGVITYEFGPAPQTTPAPVGLITSWTFGEAFAAPDSAISSILPAWTAKRTTLGVEPDGFVELNRHLKLPANTRYWGTVARVTVNAERAMTKRLDLGFSDRATVFLNGRPIFYRDDSYDYENRRDGLISLKQAAVYLPLRAGANEVSVVLTDRFGGWAIMGAFPDMAGLKVEAK